MSLLALSDMPGLVSLHRPRNVNTCLCYSSDINMIFLCHINIYTGFSVENIIWQKFSGGACLGIPRFYFWKSIKEIALISLFHRITDKRYIIPSESLMWGLEFVFSTTNFQYSKTKRAADSETVKRKYFYLIVGLSNLSIITTVTDCWFRNKLWVAKVDKLI